MLSKSLSGLWLLAALLIIVCIQVNAQFFTKSSKSIPRMGRRSVGDASTPISQYRHLLIDALLDEYGPNLVAALEAKASDSNHAGGEEMTLNNEQPSDAGSGSSMSTDEGAVYEMTPSLMARNERSSLRFPQNYRESSLAMRALNTNRLIQHLASGQPLMSYDRLINGKDRLLVAREREKNKEDQKYAADK